MKLRVKDIVKIWNNGAASLVAGQEGLMRRIEVFDMMEQPNIKPWLREHLLLITTGYVIRNDKEALLNLIRDMNEVNASALAIKTRFFDDFPKEALQLADELKLPLFFLDNNAGFVELVFPVMTAIVESRSNIELDTRYQIGKENKSELDNRLFFDLINRKITQPEEAEYRTASLQWPSEPVRMIALSLETEKNSFLLEMKKEQQTKAISRILEKNHIRNAVICSKEMCFALMGISINDTLLDTIVNDMIQKLIGRITEEELDLIKDIIIKQANEYNSIMKEERVKKVFSDEYKPHQKENSISWAIYSGFETGTKIGKLEANAFKYGRSHVRPQLIGEKIMLHIIGSKSEFKSKYLRRFYKMNEDFSKNDILYAYIKYSVSREHDNIQSIEICVPDKMGNIIRKESLYVKPKLKALGA